MHWYYLAEVAQMVGKTDRTVRLYLSKWKNQNPNKANHKNIYRYVSDTNGVEKLQLSSTFIQTYFNVEIQPSETSHEKRHEVIHEDYSHVIKGVEFEERLQQREENLRKYYEKQLEEIKSAKQETIDVLKQQLDQANISLNKVLEQYQMAQLTISNLIEPKKQDMLSIDSNEDVYEDDEEEETIEQSDLEEEIENIIQDQQKTTSKLRTTEEYLKSIEQKGTGKSFFDWLKNEK